MKPHKWLAAMLAAALLFSLGACSSDDEGEGDEVETEDATGTEENDEGSDEGTDDEGSDEGEDEGTDEGEDEGTDDEGSTGDFDLGDCLEATGAMLTISLGPLAAMGSEEDVAEVQEAIDQLEATAPDEIAGDIEVLVDAYADFFGAIDEYGILSDEASAASEALSSDEAVTEAQENIDAWFSENCSGENMDLGDLGEGLDELEDLGSDFEDLGADLEDMLE